MHAATTRTTIAAAALAAAGLIALPQQALPQQATPTVSRDVALVDLGSTLLDDETAFDTKFWNSVLGPTGAEEKLFTALGANAPTLLDTGGASPDYSGVFNGAESRAFEGLYIDTLVMEDHINQLLGVSQDASETAILGDITGVPYPPLPDGLSLPAVGAADFDSILQQIAGADFHLAASDFMGYVAFEAGQLGLGGLANLF